MRNRLRVVVIGCLGLLLLSVGCGSQNKHLAKGKELVKSTRRHREARAVEEFRLAIQEEPQNAEAHYLLGYYDENSPVEERGSEMFKAYQQDAKKYLEILVFETLRDREQSVREAGLVALKQVYTSGDKRALMKQLKKAIESKDSRDRYDAQWVLAELGKSLPETERAQIVDMLIELLDHKRLGTRLEAVIALGEIRDPRAVEPLVKIIESGSAADEDDREDPEVRRLAVEALGKIGDAAIDELIRLVQNKGSSLRVDAIEALAELHDPTIIDTLIDVLGEEGSRRVEVAFRK